MKVEIASMGRSAGTEDVPKAGDYRVSETIALLRKLHNSSHMKNVGFAGTFFPFFFFLI